MAIPLVFRCMGSSRTFKYDYPYIHGDVSLDDVEVVMIGRPFPGGRLYEIVFALTEAATAISALENYSPYGEMMTGNRHRSVFGLIGNFSPKAALECGICPEPIPPDGYHQFQDQHGFDWCHCGFIGNYYRDPSFNGVSKPSIGSVICRWRIMMYEDKVLEEGDGSDNENAISRVPLKKFGESSPFVQSPNEKGCVRVTIPTQQLYDRTSWAGFREDVAFF
ncbi:hypothetical protein BU17DRAFT_62755 [Hysterangium stoloniferum]|nr:hypothetical protein BU17DRAFT_62755 [Hysterangium stoloniferum]